VSQPASQSRNESFSVKTRQLAPICSANKLRLPSRCKQWMTFSGKQRQVSRPRKKPRAQPIAQLAKSRRNFDASMSKNAGVSARLLTLSTEDSSRFTGLSSSSKEHSSARLLTRSFARSTPQYRARGLPGNRTEISRFKF
jgi:hypothetical protein